MSCSSLGGLFRGGHEDDIIICAQMYIIFTKGKKNKVFFFDYRGFSSVIWWFGRIRLLCSIGYFTCFPQRGDPNRGLKF